MSDSSTFSNTACFFRTFFFFPFFLDGLPGASDAFFEEGCELLVITIFTQMMWSMMFNAFLFSFFFSLMSKSEFRSSQIIFTNKLLINVNTDGKKAYARLQCYDIGTYKVVLRRKYCSRS